MGVGAEMYLLPLFIGVTMTTVEFLLLWWENMLEGNPRAILPVLSFFTLLLILFIASKLEAKE